MKLSAFAFKRFWDVHAWTGVITGLLVYVMFTLGAFVLFYRPLTVWEEPRQQTLAQELPSLQATLDLAKPLPEHEFYFYLPRDGHGLAQVGYYLPGTTAWRMWWLDAERGQVLPKRELAAAYLYDLHYLWHDVTGYYLQYGAGLLVFGFLLSIVSGVLIHLKDLRRQLHQFRPAHSRRVLWSDMHKVTAVFGLPFQLVYAWTGAIMALAPLLFQLSIGPVFGGDERRALETAGALAEEAPALDYGPPAESLSLDDLVAKALVAEPRLTPEYFGFRGYGLQGATVEVHGPIRGEPFGNGTVALSAHDGSVVKVETPDDESAVGTLARFIHGLHTVEYGGLLARWLMFVLAVAGCLAILTGNWVWLERRRAQAGTFGHRILARLTVGIGAGVPVSVATLLLTSRLLPLDSPSRTINEQLVMAALFGACVLYALLARQVNTTWWRMLSLAALLFCALPFVAIRHSDRGLFGGGEHEPTVFAVDLAFLLGGLVLLAISLLLRHGLQRDAQAKAPTWAGEAVKP